MQRLLPFLFLFGVILVTSVISLLASWLLTHVAGVSTAAPLRYATMFAELLAWLFSLTVAFYLAAETKLLYTHALPKGFGLYIAFGFLCVQLAFLMVLPITFGSMNVFAFFTVSSLVYIAGSFVITALYTSFLLRKFQVNT